MAGVGPATFVRVAVLDIVVGLKAADTAEKSALSDRYADVPAVLPQAFYEIGPLSFMLGLVAMLVQYAAVGPRRGLSAALSPALILLGFVAIMANMNLLPVGAAMIWFALVPIARGTPRPRSARPPRPRSRTRRRVRNHPPGRPVRTVALRLRSPAPGSVRLPLPDPRLRPRRRACIPATPAKRESGRSATANSIA